MNREVEQTLERQPLRGPSANLDMRVLATIREHAPGETGRSGNPRLTAMWVTLGAAAAAAIALAAVPVLGPGRASRVGGDQADGSIASVANAGGEASGIADGFDPIEMSQEVTRLDPQSLLLLDDQTPVRPVVAERVQRFQWVDPRRRITMELEVPRREVVLISAPAD